MSVKESCFYCGSVDGPFHEDHVVPFSRGGSSLPRNLVLSCAACNLSKSDQLPSEWRQDLNNRVYDLEEQLVAWHQQVDERRRYSVQGITKGCWVLFEEKPHTPFQVEVIDSRGMRVKFPGEKFSRWYAWSQVKQVCVVEADSFHDATIKFLAPSSTDALRSRDVAVRSIKPPF